MPDFDKNRGMPPLVSRPSTATRSSSTSSAVSHMDLQIKHHWNDAVAPSRFQSRSVTPSPPVSDQQIQDAIAPIISSPSRLSPAQKGTHVERLKLLDTSKLSAEQKAELYEAVNRETSDLKRKAIVEFIRNNDGMIKWAASLRSLAESMLPET